MSKQALFNTGKQHDLNTFFLRSDTSKASKLVIAATDDDAQKLSLLINKAVQNKQHSSRNGKAAVYVTLVVVL